MALNADQQRAVALAKARQRQAAAQPAQPATQEVGAFSAFGSGIRRGLEEITGGAGQRLFEGALSFEQSQIEKLAEGINSGEIPATKENIELFDRLSANIGQSKRALGGAEQRETQRRGEFAPIQEQQPIAALGGRIAGQIIPTLAAPSLAAKTLLGRTAVAGATGALGGAIQPTIEGESAAEKSGIGAAIGAVIPFGLEKVAIPAVKAAARPVINKLFKTQTPIKNKIAELVTQNSDDVQRAGFTVSPSTGNAVKDRAAQEAIKQGMDDGTVALIQSAGKSDKATFRRALDMLKKGRASKTFAVSNRPGDAAGNVLKSRYDAVKKINSEAGKEVNQAAKGLEGKPADITEPYSQFLSKLQDLGVSITRGPARGGNPGKLKGVYQDSEFALATGTQKILDDFIARSERGTMDALSAHRLKKVISGSVEFGKKNTQDPILSSAESLLKTLRRGINENLQGISPSYKAANEKFSGTRQALDSFEKAAGPSFDASSDNAAKQLVNTTRSLMSNNQKRVPAMDAINALQESAKKYGVTFDDDILKQAAFMDDLENLFGSAAPTSFGGQIEKAASRAVRGDRAGIAADAVEATIKKARGINEDALMRALEKMLE